MQKLSSYIGTDLRKKAKLLHRLTLSIRMQLPTDLARHCWVASIENRTLTIITDDPSRASLVRFQQHEILKQLNQELSLTVKEYLNRIKIRISNVASGVEPPTKSLPLSNPSAQLINKCAKSIKHTGLKDALQHLAQRSTSS